MKYIATIIILLSGLTTSVRARQQTRNEGKQDGAVTEQSDTLIRFNKILDEEKQKGKQEPGNALLPDVPSAEVLDEDTKALYASAMREYYGYRVSGYRHRREVFAWQLYSSKIIFYVVIFLVLAGIYFSGIQFHRSHGREAASRYAEKNGITEAMLVEGGEVTEIIASVKGIKVSSPILGVVILVISLLFFYLYLVFVYPVNEVL